MSKFTLAMKHPVGYMDPLRPADGVVSNPSSGQVVSKVDKNIFPPVVSIDKKTDCKTGAKMASVVLPLPTEEKGI